MASINGIGAMNSRIRVLFLGMGVALVSVPVGLILTFLLTPFWTWVEATVGIESIGHSGPAEWCYLVVVGVVFCGIGGLLMARGR